MDEDKTCRGQAAAVQVAVYASGLIGAHTAEFIYTLMTWSLSFISTSFIWSYTHIHIPFNSTSASSGITVSPELTQAFSDAVDSQEVPQDFNSQWCLLGFMFDPFWLCISCYHRSVESLVPDDSIAPSGTLEQDLNNLANILDDNVPAYILVRLDDPPSEWLAVFYVPHTAKVRDKVCGHSILLEYIRSCSL